MAERPGPQDRAREKAEAIAMSAHVGGTHKLKASAEQASLTPRDAARSGVSPKGAGYSGDSEAGMLSGISRKRRMRSGFY